MSITAAAQIRIGPDTLRRLNVLAGVWGLSIKETADRIIETYVSGDSRWSRLMKDAEAAGKEGRK